MKRFVKIILSFLLPAIVVAGCTSDIEERINKLRDKVSGIENAFLDLNKQIQDLNALITKVQSGDHIVSIQEVTAGCYVLTFESKDILMLKDGTDGKTPVIGIRYDSASGFYCWTVQQGTAAPVWLTDSYGRRISAEATVPKLRISEGRLGRNFRFQQYRLVGSLCGLLHPHQRHQVLHPYDGCGV